MDFEALMKQYLAGPSEEDTKRARQQAIAQAGMAILGARTGGGWQGALRAAGQGGLLGLDAYQQSLQGMKQDKRQGLQDTASLYNFKRQYEGDKRADEQRQALEAARRDSMMPGSPEMGPPTEQGGMQPAVPPSFNFNAYANRVAGIDPAKALEVQKTIFEMTPKPVKPESRFAKINPSDYTRESVEKFILTGKESDLVAVDKRPVTNNNVSVNTGPKAFWGDFGKGQSDVLFKGYEAATKASDTIAQINQSREAVAGGALQGGFATPKLALLNGLKGVGIEVDDRLVANTGALKASLKQTIMGRAKELGTNPSNIDIKLLDDALGGIDTDPNALNKVLDWMESQARNRVRSFNKQYSQAMKQPNSFSAFDMAVPEPEPYRSPEPKGGQSAPAIRYDRNGRRIN